MNYYAIGTDFVVEDKGLVYEGLWNIDIGNVILMSAAWQCWQTNVLFMKMADYQVPNQLTFLSSPGIMDSMTTRLFWKEMNFHVMQGDT